MNNIRYLTGAKIHSERVYRFIDNHLVFMILCGELQSLFANTKPNIKIYI